MMQPPATDLELAAVLSGRLAASKEQFGSSCPKVAAELTVNLKHRMLKENGVNTCTKNGTEKSKEKCESNGHTEEIPENSDCTPTKKLKLENNSFPNKPWKLRAVLGEDALLPVPLVKALAAQIINKKETSKLIQKLNEVLPLPSLQHLKRVKSSKDYILLLLWPLSSTSTCPLQNCDKNQAARDNSPADIDPAAVQSRLVAAGVDPSVFSENFRVEQVAEFAPLTRRQFDMLKADNSYWPCNFHEDKYFESLVNGSHELWSSSNHDLQEGYMLRATSYYPQSGGVVVDPSTNMIIAEGHGTQGHPLHHTVLNLVDLVARSQGGGALQHTSSLPTFNYTKELGSSGKSSRNGSIDENEEDEKPTTSHNHLKRFGSIAQLSTVPKTGPYLCTGYDVYLSQEPCHMCSMALIHMRTRRVFYSSRSRDGALGTSDKIHTLHGLNHRYEVYAGILHDQDKDKDPSQLRDCC